MEMFQLWSSASSSRLQRPKDHDEIAKNRAKHLNGSKGQPTSFRPPFKWRKPEEGEHNKRVIDLQPHTWDPNSGRNGR